GYQVPTTTNGDGAIRCVYLTNGASLVGFTLSKGATRNADDSLKHQSGGGVFCETFAYKPTILVSNCVIIGNSAAWSGGGAAGGVLNNCSLIRNSAQNGGGGFESTLNNCVIVTNL